MSCDNKFVSKYECLVASKVDTKTFLVFSYGPKNNIIGAVTPQRTNIYNISNNNIPV